MNTTIDAAAQRRRLVLEDAISHCWRAARAASAAHAGEQAVLQGIRQRLGSLLKQLQALK
jgi:hypothetical protein